MTSSARRLPLLRLLAGACLCWLLAGCQQTYFRVLNSGGADLEAQVVIFDESHGLALDIYRPASTGTPAPVVVFFYGGSWQHGRREYYRFVGRALAAQGFLVLIPDYRKAPDEVFPAFIEDAAKATAWAHRHAVDFGGDPSRLFLMGHSAGAHIAALLGTDPRYLGREGLRPLDLGGVVGLAGPYDFLPITNKRLQRVFADRSDWPASQPVNFVDGDEPPFLLLHGESDGKVGKLNSERLAARLQAQHEPVRLRILPGVGHLGLVNGFASSRFSPVLSETVDWMRAMPATRSGPAAGAAAH